MAGSCGVRTWFGRTTCHAAFKSDPLPAQLLETVGSLWPEAKNVLAPWLLTVLFACDCKKRPTLSRVRITRLNPMHACVAGGVNHCYTPLLYAACRKAAPRQAGKLGGRNARTCKQNAQQAAHAETMCDRWPANKGNAAGILGRNATRPLSYTSQRQRRVQARSSQTVQSPRQQYTASSALGALNEISTWHGATLPQTLQPS